MATTSIGAPGVLFPDGTTQASAAGAAPVVRIYTSPSPWTKPATLKAVKVTIVAGGGGASFAPTSVGSGGGGAAGYLFLQAPSIPGPVTITVGTGGTAVPGPNATAPSGTPSSFGALATATGGAGVTAGAPGLGGSMSTTPTIFACRGQTGNPGVGAGNAGFGLGLGALSPNTTAVQNGAGYGFGGRGFSNPGNPGICTGGAGIVVVEEFY
jgi:hypothetical protein